jgi:hypothetical protein
VPSIHEETLRSAQGDNPGISFRPLFARYLPPTTTQLPTAAHSTTL